MLDNRFFHTLYNHLPLGIIIFNNPNNGSACHLNSSATSILGYHSHDARGLTFETLVHPDDLPEVTASIQRIEQESIPDVRTTAHLKHRSEVFVHVDLNISLLRYSDTTLLVFTFQQSKEIKKRHFDAEKKAITNTATWKIAHSIAGISIWEMNLETEQIEWSDTSCQFLEPLIKDRFYYSDFIQLVHVEDRDFVMKSWRSAVEKGTVYDLAHRVVCEDHIKWIRMQCEFELGPNDKPLRAIGVIKDITEKKIAKDQLEKRNKDLQQILSAIDQSSLVTVVDPNGTILKVNKRFSEVSKYTQEELIGKKHNVLNSGYHDKEFWSEFWSTIKQGKVWRGEIRNRAKDGSIYWVYTTINPILNETGEVVHYLTIRQDITPRKIYEDLLIKVNSRLAQIEEFINFTSDAIQVCAPDGTFIYINQAAAERLGISRDDCGFHNIIDVDFLFNSRSLWYAHVEEAKRLGSVDLEGMHTNKETGIAYPAEATMRHTAIDGNDYIIIVSRDISERRKNELALRQSQARLAEAQRIAKLGCWEWDLSDNQLWWSDEQYDISAMTRSPVPLTVGAAMRILHPDDRSSVLKALCNTIRTGVEASITYRIVRADGEVRLILGYASRMVDQDGNPTRLSGVNLDVTDRINTEQALRQSEEALRKAQAVAKIGSWKLNVSIGELEWSAETYKIFGLPQNKKLTYADFLSLVHPEDKEFVDKSWKAALTGQPYDIVHRIIANNNVKWVREYAELTIDEHRKLSYGFGIVQDITDHKNLQDAHEIFNQSLLLTGIGSWCVSLKNRSLFLSDNVYNLHELPKSNQSITLENYLSHIFHEDRGRIAGIIRDLLAKEGSFEAEYRVDKAGGGLRWLSVNGKVLADNDGNPVEVYGIVRDITAEKNSTAELIQARKAAEEAAYVKDHFLSIMSHEIRTPLNSVIGLSNLILKREPRKDQLEIMRILKGSADNLLHLVNDILDFNKIRSGKLELELLPFSLSMALEHIHASFKLSAQDKGITFSIHIDPRIPDVLLGDVTRLNQIFNNLVGNAIKFTHKGYVRFKAELKSKTNNNTCRLVFKVEDTGVGIPAERIKSIFEPFRQSESNTSRKYGGTGLGLSIVKSLVQILDGEIHVSSAPGKGSVFIVELPLIYSQALTVADERPVNSIPQRTTSSNNRLRVLYVEDVESNRFLIRNLLSDNEIDTVTVSSGKAALQATRQAIFDLILMDIQMPGMDGYETTRKIRQQIRGKNNTTPVLAFTAEPYSEDLKKKVADHNISDVVTKPFDAEMLIDKIVRLTQSRQSSGTDFSFAFYENAFKKDIARLSEIKRMVIQDVKRFSKKVNRYTRTRDEAGLRAEVHRIRPILKKMQCTRLIDALEKCIALKCTPAEIQNVQKHLAEVLFKLTSLNY